MGRAGPWLGVAVAVPMDQTPGASPEVISPAHPRFIQPSISSLEATNA